MSNPFKAMTDEELIQAHNPANNFVFAEIYNRYSKMLYSLAIKSLTDPSLAEDVIQNVFLKMLINNRIKDVKFLRIYLYTAVRNECFTHISSSKRKGQIVSLDSNLHSVTADNAPDLPILNKQLMDVLETYIAEMPPTMRRVFELSRKNYLSHKQIAKLEGINEKTVKSHIVRALKFLRLKLGTSKWLCIMIILVISSRFINLFK
jgi:RNA polymerase sigma-70 factor, ECF subfamily